MTRTRTRFPTGRTAGLGGLAAVAGALMGCLSPNPNLLVTESESDSSSTVASASGAATNMPTDETATTHSDTASSDGPSTTGPSVCGSGYLCAPEAPEGWNGPVAWAQAPLEDDLPECPETYPEAVLEAYADLIATPAECICECGSASGASCGNLTLEFHGTNATCVGGAFNEFPIGNSCQQGPAVTASNRRWSVDQPGVTGGSCSPSASVVTPKASWSSRTIACAEAQPDDSGLCGDFETCVPEPRDGFESQLCIWQPGVVECPKEAFVDQRFHHTGFTDTRDCEPCTCGAPEGECAGTVRLWSTNSCTGTESGFVQIGGECAQATDSVSSADRGALTVSGVSCQPSPGTATGQAEPSGTHTLCCMGL